MDDEIFLNQKKRKHLYDIVCSKIYLDDISVNQKQANKQKKRFSSKKASISL